MSDNTIIANFMASSTSDPQLIVKLPPDWPSQLFGMRNSFMLDCHQAMVRGVNTSSVIT